MRWLLVIICTTPFLPAQPVETVDFSLPPKQGLTIDVRSKHITVIESTTTEREGNRAKKQRGTATFRESFKHRFTAVTDGEVREAQRSYGESVRRFDRGQALPLLRYSGREDTAFRVRWADSGDAQVRVKDSLGDWGEAEPDMWSQARLFEVRSPIVPIARRGQVPRGVGETWKIDYVALFTALGDSDVLGMEIWSSYNRLASGDATAKLIELKSAASDGSPASIAVIRLSLSFKVERRARTLSQSHGKWTGEALYDVENRVFVRCTGEGTWWSKSTHDARDPLLSYERSATVKTSTTGKIVPSDG